MAQMPSEGEVGVSDGNEGVSTEVVEVGRCLGWYPLMRESVFL